MGNCFGKSRARRGPKYEVIERHMEVDGKLFTEKEATTISMDAYGNTTTLIEVTRTIAVGEKTTRKIVDGADPGQRSETVSHRIGLKPEEAKIFEEEWNLKWNQKEASKLSSM